MNKLNAITMSIAFILTAAAIGNSLFHFVADGFTISWQPLTGWSFLALAVALLVNKLAEDRNEQTTK